MQRLLLLLLSLAALLSCSVKEDRSACPCLLVVSLDRIPGILREEALQLEVLSGDGRICWQDPLRADQGPLRVQVPRGHVRIGAAWDALGTRAKAVLTPSGSEADSLFAYSAVVPCQAETVTDTVWLHKQWCTLHIQLLSPDAWVLYRMEIQGRWNGLALDDLSPIPGELTVEPRLLRPGLYEGRIPRQGDDGLRLKIFDPDRGPEAVCDYPLGELMRRSGYDWTEPDLRDLTVTLDPTQAEITVEIAPWDTGNPFGDITI